MKIVVLYDSVFGNTKKVAEAMADALKAKGAVTVSAADLKTEDIADADALVVGSPTRAFNPTPVMTGVLKSLPNLAGKKALVFDTRSDKVDLDSKMFNFFEKFFGYAAAKMARVLKRKGAAVVAEPMGFFVAGVEGPMKDGEIERATEWAKAIL
ncbi:MAG: flavodoxin family protein [Eubacteriales bacterium]